jgi:hypothetical protein
VNTVPRGDRCKSSTHEIFPPDSSVILRLAAQFLPPNRACRPRWVPDYAEVSALFVHLPTVAPGLPLAAFCRCSRVVGSSGAPALPVWFSPSLQARRELLRRAPKTR